MESEKAGEFGAGRAIQPIESERRRKRRNAGNPYDAEVYEPEVAAAGGYDEENSTDDIENKVKSVFERVIGAAVNGMKKVINWLSGDGKNDEIENESEQ